ncbi:helix-turn-helix domain-containing protein [Streptomyces sp. NPDC050485]|uniref:helix-turn-helix domain-containing protein n=1 Tax=Streptomyces sp. NPDC050485 TaxID=3365617 RepID=UPI0037B9C8F0
MADRLRTCASCGCRLSQYNASERCAACAKRTALPADPLVPPGIWQDPDVQGALASADFGALSRLIRTLGGVSQVQLAAATGLSQSYLSLLESGRRHLTNINKINRFLDAVGAPKGTRDLRPAAARRTARVQAATPPIAEADAGLASRAAQLSARFAARHIGTNVCDDDLEDLSVALARIARDYVHTPLQPLLAALLDTTGRAFTLLEGRQAPAHSRELFRLAGTGCLLLAHASQNLGDEKAAMTQVRTAWMCAERADHHGLRAWTNGTAALICEWSPLRTSIDRYTQRAAAYAPPGESRIRIAAVEARAAARRGDRDRAEAALAVMRHARDEHAQPGGLGEFGGILTFPEAKQEYYLGGTYALLGDHRRAEQHAAAAIALYERGAQEDRSYGDEALARLDIATARVATGEVEGARAQLQKILDLPANLRIRQLGSAVHRIGSRLEHPRYTGSTLARELADAARSYQAIDTTAKVPLP